LLLKISLLEKFILLFLHLLTCVYIIWATSPCSRTCSLFFSDFVEEKT
jgi:hypothetical protein